MFCRICGDKMADTVKFCRLCGTKTNFVKKEKLTKDKKKITSNKNNEPWHEVIVNVPEKETSKLKIFASLMVISLLLSSLFFFYSKMDSEDENNEINNISNFDGATVHLQIN